MDTQTLSERIAGDHADDIYITISAAGSPQQAEEIATRWICTVLADAALSGVLTARDGIGSGIALVCGTLAADLRRCREGAPMAEAIELCTRAVEGVHHYLYDRMIEHGRLGKDMSYARQLECGMAGILPEVGTGWGAQ